MPQKTETGLLLYRHIQILVFNGCRYLGKGTFFVTICLGPIDCPRNYGNKYTAVRYNTNTVPTNSHSILLLNQILCNRSISKRQTLFLCFQCPLVRNTFLTGDIYRVSIIDVASPLFPLLAVVPLLCHPLSQAGSHCGDERVRVSTESESTPLTRPRRYGIIE